MRITSTERFEESTLFLEEGVDYNTEELKQDGFTLVGRGLSSSQLTEIAKRNGYDKWSWTGTIYPDDQGHYPKTIQVKFRKVITGGDLA